MRKIKEVIVVEGRYDKNTLSQVVDTLILETAGFGIFKKLYCSVAYLAEIEGADVTRKTYRDTEVGGYEYIRE